jgi:hypothetical protein
LASSAARQTSSCNLTARRRINALVERGLVAAHAGRFMITNEGRQAIGTDTPRQEPWVRKEMISAASSRDVVERQALPRFAKG